jgi:hypothetical protein
MSAFAENNERFRAAWTTKSLNRAGIYSMNMYVGGKKRPVTVDDSMLFLKGTNALRFSRQHKHQLWGPIMEKMFAKLNGNYERTISGWLTEGF